MIAVVGTEKYKGGTRVSFVCGHRALHALDERRTVLDRLVGLLSAPVADLVDTAEKLKDDLVASEKKGRALLERALEGEALRLLDAARGARTPPPPPGEPPVIVASYEGWTAADLRVLALRLVETSPCVALLGSRADKAHLVFAQSDGLSHDIPSLLREAVALLGGHGGGKGNVAQGGGERVERLAEALDQAADAVRAGA